MDLALTDKKAIVTGASEGIGKAVTRALAREGVDVAVCARRKGPLEAAAAAIAKETGRKIVPITADLTKAADAEKFVQAASSSISAKRSGRARSGSSSWATCAACGTCCPSCSASARAGWST